MASTGWVILAWELLEEEEGGGVFFMVCGTVN